MKIITTLLASTLGLAGIAPTLLSAQAITPVAFFDGAAGEYPESIALDEQGNAYLGLAFAGKIRKVTPAGVQSDFAQIPDSWLLGLTFDRAHNLVVLGSSGVWKVSPAGTATLFSPVPGHSFLNDVVCDQRGNLYVTDSFGHLIWKVDAAGNAVVWSRDPLLQGVSGGLFPNDLGPNGIGFDRDMRTLTIVNTSAGSVVQIDVKRDGSAGPGRILVQDQSLIGADGLELDRKGNIYIAVNIQNRIAVVSECGGVSDVLVGDILSVPTSLAFGRGCEASDLYICNNGMFFLENPLGAGLLKLELDEHGRPCHRRGRR